MADSEYYIQIFLFAATILCYVILVGFVLYGIYYCLLRSCILRRKKRSEDVHQDDSNQREKEEEPEEIDNSYRGRVKLLSPFQSSGDHKKVIIVSNSNTNGLPQQNTSSNTTSITIHEDALNPHTTVDEGEGFIHKKYYDIFVA